MPLPPLPCLPSPPSDDAGPRYAPVEAPGELLETRAGLAEGFITIRLEQSATLIRGANDLGIRLDRPARLVDVEFYVAFDRPA